MLMLGRLESEWRDTALSRNFLEGNEEHAAESVTERRSRLGSTLLHTPELPGSHLNLETGGFS
jgi:hypothetical protein